MCCVTHYKHTNNIDLPVVLFSLILIFTLLLPLVVLRRSGRQGKYFLLFQNSSQRKIYGVERKKYRFPTDHPKTV